MDFPLLKAPIMVHLSQGAPQLFYSSFGLGKTRGRARRPKDPTIAWGDTLAHLSPLEPPSSSRSLSLDPLELLQTTLRMNHAN